MLALVSLLIVLGLILRLSHALTTPLWVDEAESSINGLSVLEHGYPTDRYLDLPIYENTLIHPWEGHPEYEFKDTSYAAQGKAAYHGWLPLYSIAAAQAVFGVRPDELQPIAVIRHTGEWAHRTIVPRLPALVFALVTMIAVFVLARAWAGPAAGVAALTWAALSERAVAFGFQARYFSATLALSAVAALALWRAVQRGRWFDFVLLGLAEALLFHTHQLSALVFALAATVSLPAIIRLSQGGQKLLVASGVTFVLIVPWAWWSGFLATASAVPKVASLFSDERQWLHFLLTRRTAVALFVLILAALLAARLNLLRRWSASGALRELAPGAAFLLLWLSLAYLAVHTVIPAASYFPHRLTLMMQVGGILLVGATIGVVVQRVLPRWASVAAAGVAVGVLALTGKVAPFPGLQAPASTFSPPGAEALAALPYTPETRIYASPNQQLIYAYLAGLPVQSIAPVRREFLETYPGPIVFIEHRHVVTADLPRRAAEAARNARLDAPPEALEGWAGQVWSHHVADDLSARGLQPAALDPLPDFLQPVREHLREAAKAYVAHTRRRLPILREVDVATPEDLWLSFSYRFVDYKERVGPRLNLQSRLRAAHVTLLPDASLVIHHCPPLAAAAAHQHPPEIGTLPSTPLVAQSRL